MHRLNEEQRAALAEYLQRQDENSDQATNRAVPADVIAQVIALAEHYGLDPYLGDIYIMSFNNRKKNTVTWSVGLGISACRRLGPKTGQYEGQLGPYWLDREGHWHTVWSGRDNPVAAMVGIMRRGFRAPLWGTAVWDRAAQLYPNGEPKGQWNKRGAEMLAKVAEQNAWDRAFGDLLTVGVEADESGSLPEPLESDEEIAPPDPSGPEDPSGGIPPEVRGQTIPRAVRGDGPAPAESEPEAPAESEPEVAAKLAEQLAAVDSPEQLPPVVRAVSEALDSGLLVEDEMGTTIVANAIVLIRDVFNAAATKAEAACANQAYTLLGERGLLSGEDGRAARQAKEAAIKRMAS